jgi:23S rRNA U2552 (ribose-2'-O)-methylase RlmE/FtsJ
MSTKKNSKKSKSLKNKSLSKKVLSRDLTNVLSRDLTDELHSLKFTPLIVKLPKVSKTLLFATEPNVYFSSNIDYPRAEYGFHHFIHQSKNTTEALKRFEGKKKVYLVFNRFERYIDNYDESIGIISKKFFELEEAPDILSRGFYKLWEMLLLFDLIDLKKDKFVSAHLAEGPGSFIQATIFYRDLYCKKGLSKNDKYHAITLHPMDKKEYIPALESNFINFYEKEKPKRFMLHKTFPKQEAGGSKSKDDGDLTNPKTLKLFGGDLTQKADLITADGGFEWVNENIQEQEAFKLIIGEIIGAVKIQAKGGNFVCKFFELFTKTSVKILSMLSELYDDIYLVKPLTSRQSNSERYAVCKGFKYDDTHKDFKNISKKLDTLLDTLHKNKDDKIVDIFSDFVPDKNIVHFVTKSNLLVSNNQFENINEMMTFVNREIYSGDIYHEKRDEQIEGAKYWNDLFMQDITRQSELRKVYDNMVEKVVEISTKETDELVKSLEFVESQV